MIFLNDGMNISFCLVFLLNGGWFKLFVIDKGSVMRGRNGIKKTKSMEIGVILICI